MFKEHNQIELRHDLVYTGITICSPTVVTLFTDNFDYQKVETDLTRGTLSNDDVLDNTIYCHILEGAYAAHISNVPMYDAIRYVEMFKIPAIY